MLFFCAEGGREEFLVPESKDCIEAAIVRRQSVSTRSLLVTLGQDCLDAMVRRRLVELETCRYQTPAMWYN